MDIDAELLKALNQPGSHSGSKLGETLGISRVAVQKRLAALRSQGLPLRASAGQGYMLEPGIVLLDDNSIRDRLSEAALRQVHQLTVLREIDSTNNWIQQQELKSGMATLCVAERQTAGRGRRGAGWVASPYRNLVLSLGWRFSTWPSSLPALSLVVGLVCSQVLELLEVDGVRIKWPNDIYRHGTKLAGTLVQASGEASDYCDVVIGLGLNLKLNGEERASIDQPCSDLSDMANPIDRNYFTALLVEALIEVLPLFAEQGFSPFRSAWEQRALYISEPVQVSVNGEAKRGVMRGVDDQGSLIFKPDVGAELRFTDADISLRPA